MSLADLALLNYFLCMPGEVCSVVNFVFPLAFAALREILVLCFLGVYRRFDLVRPIGYFR
jgi:hypothetical protein